MTFSESGLSTETPTDVNREGQERETALQATTAERANLSRQVEDEALWQGIPDSARAYLQKEANCPSDQISDTLDYLRTVKAPEFGGMENIPEVAWPVILNICVQKSQDNSEIAALDQGLARDSSDNVAKRKVLETEKEANDQRHTTVEVLSNKIALNELAKTDPDLKGLTGKALLDTLLNHAFLQSRPKLKPFLEGIGERLNEIQKLASTPEEAIELESLIALSSLNFGAENYNDIFADVLARTDSSDKISEATKTKVHELFAIKTINSADDVQNVLNRGYGIDENGEKIPIPQDNKLRIRPNTYLYEMPSGDRIFELNLSYGRIFKVKFDGEINNQTLGDLLLTAQTIHTMERMSLAEPIWRRGWMIRHGGVLDLNYEDIIIAKRVVNAFMGSMAGYNDRLLSSADQARMLHDFQAFPKKGDAAHDDHDSGRAMAEYKELTIVNENGSLNWLKFEKAASYLQSITAQGGQPNFEHLKAHLTENGKN